MPLKITGKIVDDTGLPPIEAATISEIPPTGSTTGAADTYSDADTGQFTFYALNPNSLIKVEAFGFQPLIFPAMIVPPVIKLQDAVVVEGNVSKKSNNAWLWIAGGIAAVTAIAFATGGNKKTTAAKGLSAPRKAIKKKKVKPLKVVV